MMSTSALRNLTQCPETVRELVERFDLHRDTYKQQSYNEAQVRREFIDPFFTALGWDVENKEGLAEAYKDVIHEDAIKVGGFTKAPDYCFRIGGTRKFFVEAKRPSVEIHDAPGPAYQLRRYAWSSKLSLSIVTDFEEFAVYDCRIPPKLTDKPSVARVLYYTNDEYPEKWSEIADIFSKQAVLKGLFDKYAQSTKRKKGTAEVDGEFLKEIETWRETLARNIALRNESLSVRELNYAVSKIIDRIIFLRMCEDRGIEATAQLQALLNGDRVYRRLVDIFYRADERYNSGLFHFELETGRPEPPDELTPELSIDDKVLKDIMSGLYYPDCPYEFSALPAEILGQVYEQFLGRVIRLTKGHRAKVEEKPEVKKAGGVYYTPAYIVDYIVKHTVGKLVEEAKTPPKVAKLRILDPACGSGSFLLGAYQFLLNWHLTWYDANDPKKHARKKQPPIYQWLAGDWRLTVGEKKRILLNNIYGVDIDPQAVEVTKLSLLLKVLEGESQQSIENQLKLFQERALPDLGSNIKCGNSLIGPDFYENRQLDLLDEEERYRINVFDWNTEFKDIMKNGGFDAIIGNPPYVRIQGMKEWAPLEVEFYKQRYAAAGKGNYDIYVVFAEKGLGLLNERGLLGFILPHKFFNAKYGEALRTLIASGKHLAHVVHFADQQVFAGATTYTCLMFLARAGSKECHLLKINDLATWRIDASAEEGSIPAKRITSSEWNFNVGQGAALFEKLQEMPTKLGSIARMFVGLQTSADDVFILEYRGETDSKRLLHSRSLGRDVSLEDAFVYPLISGTDVRRYAPLPERQYIVFPYLIENDKATLVPLDRLMAEAPLTAEYLLENRARLESREKGRAKGPRWYGYIYLKNMTLQGVRKLC